MKTFLTQSLAIAALSQTNPATAQVLSTCANNWITPAIQSFSLNSTSTGQLLTATQNTSRELVYTNTTQARDSLGHTFKTILPTTLTTALTELGYGRTPHAIHIKHLPTDIIPQAVKAIPMPERLNHKQTFINEAVLLGISSIIQGDLFTHPNSPHASHIHQLAPHPNYIGKANGPGTKEFHFHMEGGFYETPINVLVLAAIEGDEASKTALLAHSDILQGFDLTDLTTIPFKYISGPEMQPPLTLTTPIVTITKDNNYITRLYENDAHNSERPVQMHATNQEGEVLLAKIQDRIAALRNTKSFQVALQPGELLAFNNGISPKQIGGFMHTRIGDIKNLNRHLQRVYLMAPNH